MNPGWSLLSFLFLFFFPWLYTQISYLCSSRTFFSVQCLANTFKAKTCSVQDTLSILSGFPFGLHNILCCFFLTWLILSHPCHVACLTIFSPFYLPTLNIFSSPSSHSHCHACSFFQYGSLCFLNQGVNLQILVQVLPLPAWLREYRTGLEYVRCVGKGKSLLVKPILKQS